jgi:hypothetical protein
VYITTAPAGAPPRRTSSAIAHTQARTPARTHDPGDTAVSADGNDTAVTEKSEGTEITEP